MKERHVNYILIVILIAIFSIGAFRSYYPRIRIGAIFHAFGGFEDSTVTITVSSQNTWYQVTNADGDLFQGLEADGITLSGDTLIVAHTMDIFGTIGMNFSGQVNQEYHFRVYNLTQTKKEGFELGDTGRGSSNYSKFAGALYFEVTAGDRLILQVQNITGTGDAIMKNSNFYLCYLHD